MEIMAGACLWIAGIYLACGLLFALAFVAKGVTVIDEGAHGSGIGFRIIIIPGVMVFWPLLLKKWIHVRKGRGEKLRS